MNPQILRTILSSLLVGLLFCHPVMYVVAKTTASSTDNIVVSESVDEVTRDTSYQSIESATSTATTTNAEVVSGQDEAITEIIDVEKLTNTEDVTLPAEAEGALTELSQKLADMFSTDEVTMLPVATEVVAVYHLDQPIVIPVQPFTAVTVPAVPTTSNTFLEDIVDTVSDWIFGEEETINEVPITPQDELQDSLPVAPHDPEDESVTVPEETLLENSTIESASQVWWRVFITTVFASEVSDSDSQERTTDAVNVIEILASTTSPVSDTSTTTFFAESDISVVEVSGVEANPVVSSTTPLVRLGTTTIALATLEYQEEEGYVVVIPPGVLPIGIHELQIATTTARGEINERVVVDIGGGTVVTYQLDRGRQVLVTTREDGAMALWLWQGDIHGASITNLAPYGTFLRSSPLAVFDETIFYLSNDTQSIVGYDFVSGVSFSQTVGRDGLAVVIPLRSGSYYVTPNDLDFQFVSVVDTVY